MQGRFVDILRVATGIMLMILMTLRGQGIEVYQADPVPESGTRNLVALGDSFSFLSPGIQNPDQCVSEEASEDTDDSDGDLILSCSLGARQPGFVYISSSVRHRRTAVIPFYILFHAWKFDMSA